MTNFKSVLLLIPSVVFFSSVDAASSSGPSAIEGGRRAQRQFQQNAVVQAHEPAIGRKQSSWTGWFTVPQGSVAVREKFGRHEGDYRPGTYACSPFGITKYTMVSTKNRDVDVTFTATTRDLQRLSVSVAYCYQITNPAFAVYHVENLENAMTDMLSRSILSNFGRMEFQDTIGLDRDELSHQILVAMNQYVHSAYEHRPSDAPASSDDTIPLQHMPNVGMAQQSRDWGVNINRLAITNIEYPAAVMEAMNAQRTAEMQRTTLSIQTEAQKVQTRINAEAARDKMAMDAEGQAMKLKIDTDMKLQTADAEANSKVRKAQGDAQEKTTQAEATAQALRIDAQAKADAARIAVEAEANTIRLRAAAEAEAMEMRARVYAENKELFELRKMEIAADAMARMAASPNTKVLLMDPNSHNNTFTQLLALQSITPAAAAAQ